MKKINSFPELRTDRLYLMNDHLAHLPGMPKIPPVVVAFMPVEDDKYPLRERNSNRAYYDSDGVKVYADEQGETGNEKIMCLDGYPANNNGMFSLSLFPHEVTEFQKYEIFELDATDPGFSEQALQRHIGSARNLGLAFEVMTSGEEFDEEEIMSTMLRNLRG